MHLSILQEHWLFDCNLHKLKSICNHYTGCGKDVDTGDPILPVQMPRGYGGTAILWKHDIDHYKHCLTAEIVYNV